MMDIDIFYLQLSKYTAMIFNTDNENKLGEDWVSVYIDGKVQSAYIFDNFPMCPFSKNELVKLRIV